MTSMQKRLLSTAMALALIVSMLPLSTLAGLVENSETQVQKQDGETLYYVDANDAQGSSDAQVTNKAENPSVTISKKITGTTTENEFDLTLSVRTNQIVTPVATAPDAAVTLVLDTSGSMSDCSHCGESYVHDSSCSYYKDVDNTVQASQCTTAYYCPSCERYLGENHKYNCRLYHGKVVEWQCSKIAYCNDKNCKILEGYSHRTNCSYYNHANDVMPEQSRIAAAKAAAIAFAREFCNSKIDYTDQSGNQTTKRLISLVTFSTSADTTKFGAEEKIWLDLTQPGALALFEQTVNGMTPSSTTNVADGLRHASACMDTLFEDPASYGANHLTRGSSYVLLLGDGQPNRWVNPPAGDYPTYNDYGRSISDDEAPFAYAEQWARKITTDGTKVMSAYAGTNAQDDGYQWFCDFDPNCKLASNVQDLVDAFTVALTLLRLNTKAWIVHDTLGNNISYVSGGGANVAPSQDKKSVIWTLRMDAPEIYQNGSKLPAGTDLASLTGDFELRYETTYRIRLDSTGAGAMQDQLTSTSTRLDYYLMDADKNFVDENGTVIPVDPADSDDAIAQKILKSLPFKTPKVHALSADFQFEKQAYHTGAPLSDAEFRAILNDGGSAERNFGGQPASGTDGIVRFNGLPSGQSYRIHEQTAPKTYAAGADQTIEVKWGEVYYNGSPVTNGTNAYVYKNKLEQTYTSFAVTKQWFDGNSASRPGELVITLEQYENGKKTDFEQDVKLTSADAVPGQSFQWKKTVENLPAIHVETGNSYTYKAVEKEVPDGYQSNSGTDPNVISNVALATTSVSGTKTWIDPQGTQHQDVVIDLYADGTLLADKSITLKDGEKSYTFDNLPKYKVDGTGTNGTIIYTVQEKEVPAGYAAEKGDLPFDIVNRINQAYQPITVNVNWLDNSNAYGTRPGDVTVALFADGKKVAEPVSVTGEAGKNTWNYTFAGIGNQTVNGESVNGFPVYKVGSDGKVTGERIVYSMQQTKIAPFENGDNYVLQTSNSDLLSSTNLLSGKTSVTGSKTWVVPGSFADYPKVTIKLSNGQETKLDKNAFAFQNLQKYNEAGVLNTYDVQEVIIGDGSTKFSKNSITKNQDGTWSLENEYHDKTVVSGTKTWLDNNNAYGTRPNEITVQLYADGNPVDGKTMTISQQNGWTYSFSDLEQYRYQENLVKEAVPERTETNAETGELTTIPGSPAVYEKVAVAIEYSVKESGSISGQLPEGSYKYLTSGGTEKENYNLTNTLTGKTTVSGTKTWLDNNNTYKTRPANGAEIKLYRNSEEQEIAKTTTGNQAGYEFKDLDLFDNQGVKYVYSVKETSMVGYTSTQDGFNFTNQLAQQYQTFDGEKVWIDGNSSTRPEITIHLLQDGKVYGEPIKLGKDTTTFTFGKGENGEATLPVYQYDQNGQVTGKHAYTLSEDKVDGYTTTIEGSKVFNTIEGIHNTTGLTFTKYWIAPENYTLPEASFTVKRNGEAIQTVKSTEMTKTEGGFYSYTLADLPLYSEDGKTAYSYTVEETGIPAGFSLSPDSKNNTFINVIDPGSVTLTGDKLWDANNSTYDISIQVFRDGQLFYTANVSAPEGAKANEKYTFEIGGQNQDGTAILPKYAPDGHEYQYTMKEVAVEGYTTTQTDNHFTNSYQHFPYQVIARYTATVDGTVVVNGETKTIAEGNPGYFDKELRSVAIDTAGNTNFTSADGKQYTYTFSGATLKIGDGEAKSFSGDTLSLSTPDQKYTLELNYTYTFNAPIKHTVTVNYYDYASFNSSNPTKVADSRSITGEKGSAYDAGSLNAIGIAGYSYVQTTGGALSGTLDADKTIAVWYRASGGGGGGGGSSGGGPGLGNTLIPPTTIPEEKPPLAEVPAEVPTTTIPEEQPPLAEVPAEVPTEIPETDVPLGTAPKTGDESKGILWLSLMALSALGIAAVATIGKKRKDEPEEG